MSAQALLSRAAALVDGGWSQAADARDSVGCPTEPWSEDACSWSLLGALVASLEEATAANGDAFATRDLAQACARLATILDVGSLADWNDDAARTKAEVVAALIHAGDLPEPDEDSPVLKVRSVS